MRARGKIGNYKLPFTELLESFTDITWIEIGVFKGFNAKCVLDNYDISKMYLIDPYQSNSIFSEKVMRDSKAKAKASLAPYKDIVEWKETTSNKAQSEIANHSADVIFIDGDHSYAGVMEDLRLFVPKIREGGLVIGDEAKKALLGQYKIMQ